MAAGNLIFPMVLWGNKPPKHRITYVSVLADGATLVSGSKDGQVCVWEISDDLQITPKYMLFGHTSSVTCISSAGQGIDASRCVTAAENGELFLWETSDGRCLESSRARHVHTFIKLHVLQAPTDIGELLLFCCGQYPEIIIIDPRNLQVVFSLASRVEPDWIACFCLLRPPKKPVDVIVGLSHSNVVKIWTLDARREFKSIDCLFEDESKQLRRIDAVDITYCTENQRCMMIIAKDAWQIFDASDFSMLCSENVLAGEEWRGGCFTGVDKVALYSSNGYIYLYQLPKSAVLHGYAIASAPMVETLVYCVLRTETPSEQVLSSPPAFTYYRSLSGAAAGGIIMRGTFDGEISVYSIPPVSERAIAALQQEKFTSYPYANAKRLTSLDIAWKQMDAPPKGILDHLQSLEGHAEITATLYIASQGRLMIGRSDGSIVLISATHALARQTLDLRNKSPDWPLHRTLIGHRSRVTCLLYPHEKHSRYEASQFVSGGADFCICIWDLHGGSMLHKFCVQAGVILRLLVPPDACNNRVLSTICSVASDHSIALLSVKDFKCVLLASKHLFPVRQLLWRPFDDFMVVQCEDKTVYVWQMETGHLDRVVTGLVAEEIISASRDQMGATEVEEETFANPTVQMFRALRHRQMTAVRKAVESASKHSSEHSGPQRRPSILSYPPPMSIQAVKTHQDDPDAHVMLFNLEALILALLRDEYGDPDGSGQAGAKSDTGAYGAPSSGDQSPSLSGIISRAKDTVGNVGQKLSSTAGSVLSGMSPGSQRKGSDDGAGSTDRNARKTFSFTLDSNLNMEIAQLLLSYLHAWYLDVDLDRVCCEKLGLIKPTAALCFGVMSREGHLSLMLPSLANKKTLAPTDGTAAAATATPSGFVNFARFIHWQLSSTTTTSHLLSIISMANTLMSMTNASFLPNQSLKRRYMRRRSGNREALSNVDPAQSTGNGTVVAGQPPPPSFDPNQVAAESSQIKQGWSLLAALHCVLLPDLLANQNFKPPRIELLARRWQERCTELRDAAQALLLRELARLGPTGRRALIEQWSGFLPSMLDATVSIFGAHMLSTQHSTTTTTTAGTGAMIPTVQSNASSIADSVASGDGGSGTGSDGADDTLLGSSGDSSSPVWSIQEMRRHQSTAVVLLGVIGSQYPAEIVPGDVPSAIQSGGHSPQHSDHSLARAISQCLLELLMHPSTPLLPPATPLRRAAIDLLGRGFPVWQPYIDISKVLLGLLELCINSEKLLPVGPIHFPLSSAADTCRTARHALSLIATHRPQAFIVAISKEIARHNVTAPHTTATHGSPSTAPLTKTKGELMRILEILCDKQSSDVIDMMIPFGEILAFCLDSSLLKHRLLGDIFPAVSRFNMISYCPSSRRIAFGGKTGTLAIHEMRAGKSQNIQAHSNSITAVAFSEDGKHVATYSADEGKMNFWQTSQSFLGMGQSQVKCIRQLQAPNMRSFPATTPGGTPMAYKARLVWISPKAVTLMLPNGREHRLSMA